MGAPHQRAQLQAPGKEGQCLDFISRFPARARTHAPLEDARPEEEEKEEEEKEEEEKEEEEKEEKMKKKEETTLLRKYEVLISSYMAITSTQKIVW